MSDEHSLDIRARVHGALADPTRLAIVDELSVSDRTPSELSDLLGLAGNLLAHHLDALAHVGLVERFVSSGDRRRRYVRLDRGPLASLVLPTSSAPSTVVFVCTHNSARSQLAAALWRHRLGGDATSAGTHPAGQVHPGAVAAAQRVGIDLSSARPCLFDANGLDVQVVTVCDRAHEELAPDESWWHWSIPDPVDIGTPVAFDAVIADIDARLSTLVS
jgi:protein-tyrosine-phosphatase